MTSFRLDVASDADAPTTGEYIVTPQRQYLIIDVLPVESKRWPFSFRCELRKIGEHARGHQASMATALRRRGLVVHETSRYRRGETAVEFFAAQGVVLDEEADA